MTLSKELRCRAIMFVARLLSIPIDVHGSFFRDLKKDARTASCSKGPK